MWKVGTDFRFVTMGHRKSISVCLHGRMEIFLLPTSLTKHKISQIWNILNTFGVKMDLCKLIFCPHTFLYLTFVYRHKIFLYTSIIHSIFKKIPKYPIDFGHCEKLILHTSKQQQRRPLKKAFFYE